jgi:hypothetical protein
MRHAIAGLALAAGLATPLAAHAVWRVVGPGMAVTEARSGNASLAAECIDDAMVLGIYNLNWAFENGEDLDLVIDGKAFTLHQFASADRIVFSDEDPASKRLNLSERLRAALRTGREVRLSGHTVGQLEEKSITFGLQGSEKAISAVERDCR